MPVKITVTPSVKSPHILDVVEFEDFRAFYDAAIGALDEGEKDESDLFVPVVEWSKKYRLDENVVRMARVFLCDLDAKEPDEIDAIVAHLQSVGVAFFAYTSHSHLQPNKRGLSCWRVVIELETEYDPGIHLALWDYINTHLLLGHNDLGTRKISLGYYLPQTPPGKSDLFDTLFSPGGALKIPDTLSYVVAERSGSLQQASRPQQTPPPTLYALEATLTAWIRQGKDQERKATARAARELLRGRNTIALHEGKRNGFLTSLAGYLARQFPTAGGLAQLFEGIGWDLLTIDGKYTIDTLEDMILRFQNREQAQMAERAAEQAAERAATILRATNGARDYTITEEEVSTLENLIGADWRGHIVACHKRDLHFLRPDGTYDPNPIAKEMLFVAAKTRLAVFGDYIEYTYINAKGDTVAKSAPQFLLEYGHVVREVVFDMGQSRGGYDPKYERVYLPTASPTVESVYHQEVHTWFETLGSHLIDMMASLPRLTEMVPALVLTGPASAGKTLLALGTGRIYGWDPVDGESVFTQFNATALIKQPVVFMDEKVSSAYEKEGTTLIRKWVTQGSRLVDEKYQAKVYLLGYPRLIIAANNANILATRQDMSDDDHVAFSERLVHIDMAPGVEYLGGFTKDYIQKHWLDGNKLPEHILWLAESWEIRNPGRRFLVASNDTALHESLVTRAGSAGDVAYWLLLFLDNPGKAKHLPVSYMPEKGSLRVTSQAIVQGWQFYLPGHKAPPPNVIGSVLKSFSFQRKQKITCKSNAREKTWNAWEIDPRKLRSANEMHGTIVNFDELFGL